MSKTLPLKFNPERRAALQAQHEKRKEAAIKREKIARCIRFYDRAEFIPVQSNITTR